MTTQALGPSSWLVENIDLLPRSGQVLDLACGTGRHALLLAGAGFPVHAVDADSHITGKHISAIDFKGVTRVLFKTRNSQLLKQSAFEPNFVAFSVEAADALVAQGVKLVGLDYLSVGHPNEQVPVHRAFLDHGVALLEGVDLSDIKPGLYELICFPLRLNGLDGAPCRAVLRDLP